jgi:hypothetical protein
VTALVELPEVDPLVALEFVDEDVAEVEDEVPEVEVEPLLPEPALTEAVLAAATDDVPDVPLLRVTVIAPTSETNDATLSAVTATRVRSPCRRRRRRRTSGASAAVPRRSWSRRIRSACPSGVVSLMACSVPRRSRVTPMIGRPP